MSPRLFSPVASVKLHPGPRRAARFHPFPDGDHRTASEPFFRSEYPTLHPKALSAVTRVTVVFHWIIGINCLRRRRHHGERTLAMDRARTSDPSRQAYRDVMTHVLKTVKYSDFRACRARNRQRLLTRSIGGRNLPAQVLAWGEGGGLRFALRGALKEWCSVAKSP